MPELHTIHPRHLILTSLLGLAILGWSLSGQFSTPSAEARQVADTGTRWEYNVAIVEPATLTTQLMSLGNDRWEVVSIIPLESAVDNSMGEMIKLRVDRLQVTSRRAKK